MDSKPCTRTKKDLIEKVADATGQSKSAVKRTIQVTFDHIVDELAKGNRLEFREFGVFDAKIRPGRIAQNPKTMQPVHVPARRTVKFKPSQSMRDRLKLDTSTAEDQVSPQPVPPLEKPIEVVVPGREQELPETLNGSTPTRETVIETSVGVRSLSV